jgi:hypothetical protein
VFLTLRRVKVRAAEANAGGEFTGGLASV